MCPVWKRGLSFALQASGLGLSLWLARMQGVIHAASAQSYKKDHCILEAFALASIPDCSLHLQGGCCLGREQSGARTSRPWIALAWPSPCLPRPPTLTASLPRYKSWEGTRERGRARMAKMSIVVSLSGL